MSQAEKQILTPSALNRAARDLLETYLSSLWIEGEISNFARPSSGHWYFTLKDERAQVRVAMFRNRNFSVRMQPRNGDKVLLRAQVSLFEARGEFQLIAEHMEAAGTGDLQRRFEELKARLAAEGLFAPERKQPLPPSPGTVGVITSPTGAAIHDILQVLKRRAPFIAVRLLPVSVQGAAAAGEIVRAIELANRHRLAEVLIVGRGGGSLEDLWPFNEEIVARAVAASEIPIVSAVGHEVDFAISDFSADARAATPSAAAEMISPDGPALSRRCEGIGQRLVKVMHRTIANHRQRLLATRKRLQHPSARLQSLSQRLDRLEIAMVRAAHRELTRHNLALHHLRRRLHKQTPLLRIQSDRRRLDALGQRFKLAIGHVLETRGQRLARVSGLLHSVSPLATLERGYAIVLTADGRAVRDASEVAVGETLSNRLHAGELTVVVRAVAKSTGK